MKRGMKIFKPYSYVLEATTLDSKLDVALASEVHLIYPFGLAFDLARPLFVECKAGPAPEFGEDTESTPRADKVWLRPGYDVFPILWQNFAILNYESLGTIIRADFSAAYRTETQISAGQLDLPPGADTAFTGSSANIMRRAVRDARNYNTKHVAFFDWDFLLLLKMADVGLVARDLVGGVSCKVCVVGNRKLMRRALLGFLEKAYLSYELNAS